MSTDAAKDTEIVYPESDGKPMADNTIQWDWMVKIVGELREQYAGQEVFVAGDLFWYPVQGDPKTVVAPDALVVFGRPPGHRGSYKQWVEGGIAPQVVFEVLSPNNTEDEFDEKLDFYEQHGVEEYYFIDPYEETYAAHIRRRNRLRAVRPIQLNGFVSPRLGVRFQTENGLKLFTPDGREFQLREDRVQEILEELRKTAMAFEEEHERAITESRRADEEAQRADEEAQRADEEARQKSILVVKLREMGINPDDLLRPAG